MQSLYLGNDGLILFNLLFSNLYILHSKTDIPFAFPKGLATHSLCVQLFRSGKLVTLGLQSQILLSQYRSRMIILSRQTK